MSKILHFSPPRIAVLAAAVIGAGVTVFAAAAVQQNYRQSANDPQVQLAQDAAAQLNAGLPVTEVVPAPPVDMHESLAPFVLVIDHSGRIIATSGKLDGASVAPPAGTLTPNHRFTWQPRTDTRLAAVVERYNGGYVVAARNLSEVEYREDGLRNMAALTLIGIAAVAAVAFVILAP